MRQGSLASQQVSVSASPSSESVKLNQRLFGAVPPMSSTLYDSFLLFGALLTRVSTSPLLTAVAGSGWIAPPQSQIRGMATALPR